jgi:hypothetical protein
MTTQSKKRLDICRFLCYNTGMKNEKSSNNLTVKVYSGSGGSLEQGTSRNQINAATRKLMAEAVAIARTTQELK